MKNRLSPMKQLKADKERLQALCNEQEVNIHNQIAYGGSHLGSLLLKTIFSGKKDKTTHKKDGTVSIAQNGFSSITKDIWPIAWSIAQPYLIGLITKKVKDLFVGGFKRKKKQSKKKKDKRTDGD